MLIVLGILFVAPLYYIFLFSVALKRFSPTDALANLNGELNAFSTDLWTKLVSVDVTVMVPGLATNLSILVDANDGASENTFHKLSIELS